MDPGPRPETADLSRGLSHIPTWPGGLEAALRLVGGPLLAPGDGVMGGEVDEIYR